jgi:hypothetical protein
MGSKARFVGINWYGNPPILLDFHKAVYNAFQTGDVLKSAPDFTGNADVTIAGHSLGNMVVSHAIQYGDLLPARYYMIDSAVALEAYDYLDVSATQRMQMTEHAWKPYADDASIGDGRLFAANWHKLFQDSDNRSNLSWKDRFSAIVPKIYNFYSTGEDVVENPTSDDVNVARNISQALSGNGFKRGAWWAQELVKGGTSIVSLGMDRVQAGWSFNSYYETSTIDPETGRIYYTEYPASQTTSISNTSLQVHPFFGSFLESGLTNPSTGSSLAGQNKVQYDVLARGIPALSYAAAANPLLRSDVAGNFDMQTEFRTGNQWPTDNHANRSADHWLHSDFKEVALSYVYKMYKTMIEKGGLNK